MTNLQSAKRGTREIRRIRAVSLRRLTCSLVIRALGRRPGRHHQADRIRHAGVLHPHSSDANLRGIVAFIVFMIGALGFYEGYILAAREDSRLRHGQVVSAVVMEKYEAAGRYTSSSSGRRGPHSGNDRRFQLHPSIVAAPADARLRTQAIPIAYRALQNGFDAFFITAAALIDDLPPRSATHSWSFGFSHNSRARDALVIRVRSGDATAG